MASKVKLELEYLSALARPLREFKKFNAGNKDTIGRIRQTKKITRLMLEKLEPFFSSCGLPIANWETLRRRGHLAALRKTRQPRRATNNNIPTDNDLPSGLSPAELGEALESLALETARRVPSAKPMMDRTPAELERERRCDSLREAALSSSDQEIADLATVLKGSLRIKHSFSGKFQPAGLADSFKLVFELAGIAARQTDQGIRSAARLTQARLLRELTLVGDDLYERVSRFLWAARTMASVDGGRLRIKMPLPGLSNEVPADKLMWDDPDHFEPITDSVPVPYRYMATCNKNAAYELYQMDRTQTKLINALLRDADRFVREGLNRTGRNQQNRWILLGVQAEVAAVQHIIKTDDSGTRPRNCISSEEVLSQLRCLDQLINELHVVRLPGAVKMQVYAELRSCQILFGEGRREQQLNEEILPILRQKCIEAPNTRSMHPQQSIYQHLFMQVPDRRNHFLRQCFFTDYEIESLLSRMIAGRSTP